MTEKLQKILSRAGIASRRALEQMIDQGRVTVNGKMATIGDRYEADDVLVKIDGKVVLTPDSQKVSCRVLMYHKPEGELTTLSDPENRPTASQRRRTSLLRPSFKVTWYQALRPSPPT